jgi:ferrochelatase
MCPGFSVDCLETLEEINQEARAAFLAAGGQEFHYIPCLNDQPHWITALCELCLRHLQGWPIDEAMPSLAELAAQRDRAINMGARR